MDRVNRNQKLAEAAYFVVYDKELKFKKLELLYIVLAYSFIFTMIGIALFAALKQFQLAAFSLFGFVVVVIIFTAVHIFIFKGNSDHFSHMQKMLRAEYHAVADIVSVDDFRQAIINKHRQKIVGHTEDYRKAIIDKYRLKDESKA